MPVPGRNGWPERLAPSGRATSRVGEGFGVSSAQGALADLRRVAVGAARALFAPPQAISRLVNK
jgi:hypothetical protein